MNQKVEPLPASLRTRSKVGDVMTPNVLTTSQDAPIESAVALMRERKIGALPVLRGADLVGLIAESDVLRAFVDLFAATGSGARITFAVSAGEEASGRKCRSSVRSCCVIALLEARRAGCSIMEGGILIVRSTFGR